MTPAPQQQPKESPILKQIRELHAAAHNEMCKEDADSEHIAFWKGSWLAYNNVAGLVEHMEPEAARQAREDEREKILKAVTELFCIQKDSEAWRWLETLRKQEI